MKTPMSATSTVFLGQRPVASVSTGAPTKTAERVAGDQEARGRDRHTELGGDLLE